MPDRPYLPELIDCLLTAIQRIEHDDKGGKRQDLQALKRRVLLLIADLQREKPEKPKCA